MCLAADEVNPLCDECFAKEKSLSNNFTDKDICTDCKSALKHFCWCCMISYEDEIVEDGFSEHIVRRVGILIGPSRVQDEDIIVAGPIGLGDRRQNRGAANHEQGEGPDGL